jgi:preprotein translocase subunit SecB
MTETAAPAIPQAAPSSDVRQVLAQKIYVKNLSVEVPLAPQIFQRAWQPQLDVNVSTHPTALGNDTWNLVLSVTVTAKLGEDTAFLVEVEQAGIFTVRGFPTDMERSAALGAYCPNLLFPFARQVIADAVLHAGFPQLLLQPINFDALYVEHINRLRAENPPGAAEPTVN